ncbi:hypothetical protein L1987_19433 [Smallanthus sonchifolius]|uniref:Uncharacterized protein n=1 Tax=Smallanthus sonchifolius TaxID=185202 RepID=A0ACB9IQ94_9ASTR|nr:hypothetical protein L1987_19433 [Smallanthus sonchifolius]
MIEETGTSGSGYECTEEIPVMEVSISNGGVRRNRDTDITTAGAGKRRRFSSEDDEEAFQLRYRSRRDVDVNFHENVASTAVSGTDHVSSSVMHSKNDDSISDLKAEFYSGTDIFISSNDGFSRETSTSSVICLEPEEMEMESSSTKKSPAATTAIEATSRRKPAQAVTMPSALELEEFFSKAEKYEQKRFAEKYNFDIVKDVPMEGRYQWVPLKP